MKMKKWISPFERALSFFDSTKIDKENLKFRDCLYCGKRVAIIHLGRLNQYIEEVENGEYNLHVCNEYTKATPEKREEVRRISTLNRMRAFNLFQARKLIRKYSKHGECEFLKRLFE